MTEPNVVRFLISLNEEAEDHPEEYSILEDLKMIHGIERVGIGFAGLSATVEAPARLQPIIQKALPYAYVDLDKQAELL